MNTPGSYFRCWKWQVSLLLTSVCTPADILCLRQCSYLQQVLSVIYIIDGYISASCN